MLTGLPALWRLRERLAGAAAVWPFDTGLAAPEAPVVLAEVYPSLLAARRRAGAAKRRDQGCRPGAGDRREHMRRSTPPGRLAPLFAPDLPEAARAVVAREEAWILGAGRLEALRAAPPPPPLRDDCFALPPGVNWLPVDEALARLRELAPVAEIEVVPVARGGRPHPGRAAAGPPRQPAGRQRRRGRLRVRPCEPRAAAACAAAAAGAGGGGGAGAARAARATRSAS